MERTQQAVVELSADVVPSLAPVEVDALPLTTWLEAAKTGDTVEARDGAMTMFTSALASMPPTQRNADALVQLLETPALEALETRDGQSVKELAVEALLRLGYPHALRVHPDQLDWVRALQKGRFRTKWLRVVAAVLAVGNLGLWGFLIWAGALDGLM
ncbi:MAG: hypothetical protein ACO1OB_21190 [Archangium sp.]